MTSLVPQLHLRSTSCQRHRLAGASWGAPAPPVWSGHEAVEAEKGSLPKRLRREQQRRRMCLAHIGTRHWSRQLGVLQPLVLSTGMCASARYTHLSSWYLWFEQASARLLSNIYHHHCIDFLKPVRAQPSHCTAGQRQLLFSNSALSKSPNLWLFSSFDSLYNEVSACEQGKVTLSEWD